MFWLPASLPAALPSTILRWGGRNLYVEAPPCSCRTTTAAARPISNQVGPMMACVAEMVQTHWQLCPLTSRAQLAFFNMFESSSQYKSSLPHPSVGDDGPSLWLSHDGLSLSAKLSGSITLVTMVSSSAGTSSTIPGDQTMAAGHCPPEIWPPPYVAALSVQIRDLCWIWRIGTCLFLLAVCLLEKKDFS